MTELPLSASIGPASPSEIDESSRNDEFVISTGSPTSLPRSIVSSLNLKTESTEDSEYGEAPAVRSSDC
ncbi:hypothetical protein Nepgr_025568 [Nepenthes gracilis]|uniref:Uncharacterized protein n=1 Tax=Nepenthes gracilis TaxID=150966 RepID=A0AAD3T6A9_NEPGR|nr:hypothetical protein Nepgr_025568 [Nepenthes gracilis]